MKPGDVVIICNNPTENDIVKKYLYTTATIIGIDLSPINVYGSEVVCKTCDGAELWFFEKELELANIKTLSIF